ncbi:MAG: uracil-DNA glycosylase [Treponema sp.]|jgi:DNA polymerase|nr:uracil-DNA glycosylase [Treponema sp.]
MTAEEKTALARALDLADDYLRDGYAGAGREYSFACDPPESAYLQGGLDSLEALGEEIRKCTACPLHKTRERAVNGEGAADPLVLILEDVSGEEDEEAGELLDRMLRSIALYRNTNCYLTSRVKCRPPAGENPPGREEFAVCAPFLKRELVLLKPLAILVLEKTAKPGFQEAGDPLKNAGIPSFTISHPALIQADEKLKRPAWEKLKALSSILTGLDRDYAQSLGSTRGS